MVSISGGFVPSSFPIDFVGRPTQSDLFQTKPLLPKEFPFLLNLNLVQLMKRWTGKPLTIMVR